MTTEKVVHQPAGFHLSACSLSSHASPLICPCCLHRRSTSQASNGPSYTCSLPSTPVVSHRELRVAQSEAGGSLTSRSLKSIPRRPSLFKVSRLHPRLTPLSPPLSIVPPLSPFCLRWSTLCPWVCFRTVTRRRRLPRVKETRPREAFPSNRFAKIPFLHTVLPHLL